MAVQLNNSGDTLITLLPSIILLTRDSITEIFLHQTLLMRSVVEVPIVSRLLGDDAIIKEFLLASLNFSQETSFVPSRKLRSLFECYLITELWMFDI